MIISVSQRLFLLHYVGIYVSCFVYQHVVHCKVIKMRYEKYYF